MSHLVVAPLLVPLIAGIVLILLPGPPNLRHRLVGGIASIALIAVAVALLQQVSGGQVEVYRMGNWQAPFGIVLVADRLAAVMVMITALLAASVLLYAARGTDRDARYFHVLFQMQLFGLNGAFLTGDLFNLFVFFEVLLIASYGLQLFGGGRQRTRAGLHYVVLNLIGSTLFLFAVGTLYGVLGTLNMADLAMRLRELPPAELGVVSAAGLLLFVVFALKAALAPLHLWLPGAYGHTSAPVAAMFAIMTKVGAYAILRVYSLLFGPDSGPAAGLIDAWLLPLALATVVAGTIGMLASRRLSQQTAYLVVVSAGTLLTAFALGGADAVAAGLYYLAHSTFAAAALFLVADIVGRARGGIHDQLVSGPGLARGQLLAGLFLLAAVAITGLPPLSGFLGKWLILQSSLDTPAGAWVLGVLLVTSLLGVMGLARSGSQLFFDTQPHADASVQIRFADVTAPLLLMLAGIALVIYAGPMYEFSHAAATQLVQPDSYLQAVLQAAGNGNTR
ncbi:MAG: monovalent cation/H+ antiporter subunit D [Gammaproteobacteria bacterium]|nr:monovalent cation/H+ antiporter subunit D [Gammaproteobacteria bacterium]